jgi:hypothetical protein
MLRVYRVQAPHLVGLGEFRAVGFRQVGHLVDAAHVTLIQPFGHLVARKSGHAQRLGDILELG